MTEPDADGAADRAADTAPDRAPDKADAAEAPVPVRRIRRVKFSRVLIYALLPSLALVLAMAAGFLKWQGSSIRDTDTARVESVQAAKDCTVVLMSFRADTVEQNLQSVQDRLTGRFRDTYTQVVRQVLIPSAKENHVSSVGQVAAAAPVSATGNHAVVLVFADQTLTVGNSPPTHAFPSFRVTLDKIAGRWLISGFDQL